MRPTFALISLCCAGFVTGCAPAIRRTDPAEFPRGSAAGSRLETSLKAADASCQIEEKRLQQGASDAATMRKVAETLLAFTAGSFAVGTAIYAGLDPSPKGYVVVPLSVGAAVGAVPLGVLLASTGDNPEIKEREQRIRDRRLVVRDAYHRLSEAIRSRERAEAALAELERMQAQQRLGDAKQQVETASNTITKAASLVTSAREDITSVDKPSASAIRKLDEAKTELDAVRSANRGAMTAIDVGRDAILDQRRAEVAYAKQRELDASHSLTEALRGMADVCGQQPSQR